MEDQSNVESVHNSYSNSMSSGPKKSANKWLFILIGLLLIGGLGVFLFTRSNGEVEPTPSPSFGVIPVEDGPVATTAATPTSAPVDKASIKIEIQNGTGVPGEAAFLQNKLKALGYTDISVGNASSTDYTDTTVTFAKDTPLSVQDELKKELESIYKKVVLKTSSTQSTDVVIITGLRTGAVAASPRATVRATSTSRSSATPTVRASTSPSATPRATATSTPQ